MRIFIVEENTNEYLSRVYFAALIAYLCDNGWKVEVTKYIHGITNSIVIAHGDTMSPDRIQQIKNSGNKLVIFDINDSSYLSSSYIHSPEQHIVDLIFKISGVPKENEVNELNIDRNFKITVSREKYLPDELWAEFSMLRSKIKPLPYVLWNPIVSPDAPVVTKKDRSGKVLIRGGNHFWRVLLAFRLMQDGLLDERSEFHTAAYFFPSMEKRFQYCDLCKLEKREHGMSLYKSETTPERRAQCTNPVTGWELPGEFYGGPMYGRHEFGNWNNKCPHSFLHLAKEFERLQGPLDRGFLQKLFNGDMRPQDEFVHDLSHASFAGDSKWLNTINLPPRFWEAASLGTPSLYFNRVADQDYWPHVEKDEHYFTYGEDMSDLGVRDISERQWDDASRAVKGLYETTIRGTQYPISNALLEYMSQEIEGACS